MTTVDTVRTAMSMYVVDVDIRSDKSSDKESNCPSERPTMSQSLQLSKDDKESSPAGPEGVKVERKGTYEVGRPGDEEMRGKKQR